MPTGCITGNVAAHRSELHLGWYHSGVWRPRLQGAKAALSAVQSQVAVAKALLHGANRGMTVAWGCIADGEPVFGRSQTCSDHGESSSGSG